jgi:hypothetical protein
VEGCRSSQATFGFCSLDPEGRLIINSHINFKVKSSVAKGKGLRSLVYELLRFMIIMGVFV